MNAALTVLLIGLAGLAWACLFRIVPSCCTSLFRYRLWALRDDVVDEIYAGRYDDPSGARRFVEFLETAIEAASELSALKLTLVHWSARGLTLHQASSLEELLGFAAMSQGDQDVVRPHVDRFQRATVRHALLGAPSGWMMLAAMFPLAVGLALTQLIRGGRAHGGSNSVFDEAKQHIRDEFEVEPVMALVGAHRGSRRKSFFQVI
jgi:AcrR family transcriptional regulator